MEKIIPKAILDIGSLILHDITALSGADSPVQSDRVRTLFFQKWEVHEVEAVRTLIAHFKRVWCNVRVGNWTHGHIANYVNCTNGLEATNKVLKDEVTKRQLMPILNFLLKMQSWLGEQSERRDETNPNYMKFATSHTFTTADYTEAHAWRMDNRKQIRCIQELDVYVALSVEVQGHLTPERAVTQLNIFNDSSWNSFDEYSKMLYNVFILRVDNTRPEGYKCSCMVNCKTFTCCHSLGVAMYRGTMNPPENLGIFLLGRKRKRGRRPQAAPAWERMGYDINSPVAHPQQDPAELAGNAGGGENLIAEIQGEI
jgi:hypothetical protein